MEHRETLYDDDRKVPHDPSRVDKELSSYVSDVRIELAPGRNKELLRKIDKRVLPIAIVTCLLQALTQSTLPFASIMGLVEDTSLLSVNGTVSQKVCTCTITLLFRWRRH